MSTLLRDDRLRNPTALNEAQEIRDLTKIIREIDTAGTLNEIRMTDANGREVFY